MSTSLSRRCAAAYAAGLASLTRVRDLWFTLLQTSVAAGLAWYIAHDLLDHAQPFFAPVAAAVCLSASNVLRAQRAIQMMIGVSLGITIGALVQAVLGTGTIPITVAALATLCAAVFIGRGYIGQGLMFVNQAVVSSILVLALYRTGVVFERIYDALLGGSLAIVFAVLLFPANPLTVLRDARIAVLHALANVLTRTADVAAGKRVPSHDWPLAAVDRVHEQVGSLIQARTTAGHVVRLAPRRWGLRDAVRSADHQATHVGLLTTSVLHLTRVVAAALEGHDRLTEPVHAVLVDLAAAVTNADTDPVAAIAHADAALNRGSTLLPDPGEPTESGEPPVAVNVVLADVVEACVYDLRRVIELAPP
jgi:uncharacterized membrane protein YgaE (UPF0421/DUF939 family)